MSKKALIGLGAAFATVGGIYAARNIEVESKISGTVTEYYHYSMQGDCADHCQYILKEFVVDNEHNMLLETPQLLVEGQFLPTHYVDVPWDNEQTRRLFLAPDIEDALAQGADLEEGAIRIGDQVNVTYTKTLAEILNVGIHYSGKVQELEVVESAFDSFSIE